MLSNKDLQELIKEDVISEEIAHRIQQILQKYIDFDRKMESKYLIN